MVKYTIVMPFVYEPYFIAMRKTLKLPQSNFVSVNNTLANRGVSVSWNLGVDNMKKRNADWLIIMSAAVRFGEAGGKDVIEQLEAHPDADVIHFASKEVRAQPYHRGMDDPSLGWHLTAINKSIINEVGYFDTNFYPGYFEDIDYDLRINKAFPRVKWLILPVDALIESIGHSTAMAGVKIPVNDLIAYFATKWGRHPSAAQLGEYERPFDDENNSLAFFPPAHGRTWND